MPRCVQAFYAYTDQSTLHSCRLMCIAQKRALSNSIVEALLSYTYACVPKHEGWMGLPLAGFVAERHSCASRYPCSGWQHPCRHPWTRGAQLEINRYLINILAFPASPVSMHTRLQSIHTSSVFLITSKESSIKNQQRASLSIKEVLRGSELKMLRASEEHILFVVLIFIILSIRLGQRSIRNFVSVAIGAFTVWIISPASSTWGRFISTILLGLAIFMSPLGPLSIWALKILLSKGLQYAPTGLVPQPFREPTRPRQRRDHTYAEPPIRTLHDPRDADVE